MIYLNSKNRSLKTAVSRTMLLAFLTAVFLIVFSLQVCPAKAFAAEGEEIALTVSLDGTIQKQYTLEDLEQIAAAEGNKSYTFSAWNTYPSFRIINDVKGPTVQAVLEDAGVLGDVRDTGTVVFSDNAYKVGLTGKQLFGETRCYFPQGRKVDQLSGLIPDDAYTGATEVPAVLYLSGGSDGIVLYFGQVAPNEENLPGFVKYLSRIDVSTADAQKCIPVEADPADGSDCAPGQEIVLSRAKLNNEFIYYTFDPDKTPDYGCVIYNSGSNQGLETRPVLPDEYGPVKLSVVVKGYGKLDSDLTVFNYIVKEPAPEDPEDPEDPQEPDVPAEPEITRPATPSGFTAAASSYNSILLTWKPQNGISGFRIYRAAGGEAMSLYKTVGAGTLSFTDSGLKTGRQYTYALAAINTGKDGKVLESAVSVSVSAKPSLARPSVKLKAGKRKATVKWSKIAGAKGYVIYRSTKKSSGFRKIKTIKKGSTKTYTDKKLKKGKKYYYKIRAYRTVDGKKVYSSYSTVKKVKVK